MECIIFVGIQATGKSSFYREKFFHSHVHINLDKLRTRFREELFMNACLQTQMPFVVDNTNPTVVDRQRYIEVARTQSYRIIGYYFQSRLSESIQRNVLRSGNVPNVALRATYSKLEIPAQQEGFDELWYVELIDSGFVVKAWQDEV